MVSRATVLSHLQKKRNMCYQKWGRRPFFPLKVLLHPFMFRPKEGGYVLEGVRSEACLPFFTESTVTMWMVYSLVVRVCGLEYGGREFESRSLHLKLETKLCEERGAFWL